MTNRKVDRINFAINRNIYRKRNKNSIQLEYTQSSHDEKREKITKQTEGIWW